MYQKLSAIYDNFINIDYPSWIAYIESLWAKAGVSPNLVLDLGCGTGNFTIPLAKKGYDMIGVDSSVDMLTTARTKALEHKNILFLEQDMRHFELYGTVDAVISMVDSINYILDEDELLRVFRLVNNYLNPECLFIFDINTMYKYRNILADNSFCDIVDNAAVIWENYYDNDSKINEYIVNIFMQTNDNLYERHEELHTQRAYETDDIQKLLKSAGFEVLAIYDALTFHKPHEKSEKIFFVAKKQHTLS
ncbi:MAG: methyltransferase domain-containing protein [Defluviitaleaceae bacterium]|nr:methyltransferase domain-containing protein [Defluviitaleaceae bacterium]